VSGPRTRGAALTLRERERERRGHGHGGGSEREVEEEAWRSRRVVDLNADDAIGHGGG